MRGRYCYRCGKQLNFDDFLKNNNTAKTPEELKRIWNSNYIELYCCHCYCFKTKYQHDKIECDDFRYY